NVRLRRLNADVAKAYPPQGDTHQWWDRLKSAMGTVSSDFVSQTLYQLQTAARLPNAGISEIGVNSALSIIEAAKADNEVEAACANRGRRAAYHCRVDATLSADVAVAAATIMTSQRLPTEHHFGNRHGIRLDCQ